MLLLAFTVRHLFRHWRLNLAILLGLTLAAALLAGLPAYAGTMAARSLHETLLSHALPAERNLSVSTEGSSRLTTAVYGLIEDALGELLIDRIVLRETTVPAFNPLEGPEMRGNLAGFNAFRLWGFEVLREKVGVVDGRLPAHVEAGDPMDPLSIPPLEAAVGVDAAAQAGLRVGDRVTSTAAIRPIIFKIVGIVEPLDPEHDMWWGDLAPFGLRIDEPRSLFEDPYVTLSLLVPPQTLSTWFSGLTTYWRVLVDGDKITVDNAQRTLEALTNLQTRLRSHSVTMSTALPKILADFQAELATARMALFLLAAQAFVFVLYALAMMTSFLLDRSEGELATMAGRGGSRIQMTLVFALEGLVLALLAAVLLGPLLADGVVKLWGALTGAPVPSGLPTESWVLALIAVGLGWLAIVLPVYRATRRTLLEWQYRLARPARLAGWQRLYLDVVLLLVGGLVYWQLSQSGSFIMSQFGETRLADPFLLLGSSVLLIAVALVFLRIFPYLLSLASWIAKRGRRLVLSLGLSRLARAPVGPSRVVLLISLTVGLSLFTNAFVSSLGVSQGETAHYLAGADLRISLTGAPTAAAAQSASDLPGVLAATPVFRAAVLSAEGKMVFLLAIDPKTFAEVARYRPGMDDPSMSSLMQVLEQETLPDVLPAIFSRSAVSPRVTIGGQLLFSLAAVRLTFEISEVVDDFPTLSGPFIVTSLPALEKQMDLDSMYFARAGEAWLHTDPAQHAALASDPSLNGRIRGDAQAELGRLQADAMAQGTTGAFELNTLVLGLLSVAGFLLVHYFAARQRTYEFGLLRAMGLAPGQLFALLVTEGVLVVGLGLLAGTGIGYGLVQVMFPYLSGALAASLAGVEIRQIVIDWPASLRLYAVLVGFYVLAMVVLLLALVRSGLHRVLRLGEE